MPSARSSVESPKEKLDEVQRRYAGDDARPLGGYVRTLSTFTAIASALTAVVAKRGGAPEEVRTRDLALATIASFRLSRIVTHASVTAPLRAPFTRFRGPAAPGEVSEEVAEPEGGHKHAVGELVTCPYCFGMWTATAFTFGMVLAPRWTRLAASVLTVSAGSDALQKLYEDLQAR